MKHRLLFLIILTGLFYPLGAQEADQETRGGRSEEAAHARADSSRGEETDWDLRTGGQHPEEAANRTRGKSLFKWDYLYSGSWEENRRLFNRGDVKIEFLPLGLALRAQVVDRHPLDFDLDPFWGDPADGVTNPGAGLYHRATGSRLLYGILDVWGLSARIRNPWIRSAPFAENRKPAMADLKTAVSVSGESEAYLYLSTPSIRITDSLNLRGFLSAQSQVENFTPALSAGIDAGVGKKISFALEGFFKYDMLPEKNESSWFAFPPPMPEREHSLYALSAAIKSPFISVTSDWAYSDTFFTGGDIYGNIGIFISPLLPALGTARITRPLTFSLAMDWAGENFIGSDSASHGAGFRGAGKIEWKGAYSSLLRFSAALRSPGITEKFNRSSFSVYYRFPSRFSSGAFPFRPRIVSFSADRNASNLKKATDLFKADASFSLYFPASERFAGNPLNLNFSVSHKNTAAREEPLQFAIPFDFSDYDSVTLDCELSWSPLFFVLSTKWGYSFIDQKDNVLNASFTAAIRAKNGRFSVKFAWPDFPETWNCTISWRIGGSGT